METLRDDIRVAVRSLLKARGYTASALLTLAFGLALAIVVLSVVNAYLVRSLPYPASERLYSVIYAQQGEEQPDNLETLDWASLSDVVEQPIAWDLDVFYMLGGDGAFSERAPGAWVTPGFMNGLGIRAALGRTFSPNEFLAGAPQVVLISHDLWIRRFAGDSSVLGRRIDAYVSDRPRDPEIFTIVGVLPEDFWHLNPYTQILTPLRAPTYPYMVRLRENAPPAVAEDRITALVRGTRTDIPTTWRVSLESTHARYVERIKPMLLAIGGAVAVVLVIACGNVALLTLLRGIRRRKDIAVRLALGAQRREVARLLVTETAVLTAASVVIGTLLAMGIMRALAPTIEQQLGRTVPGGAAAMSIDLRVVAGIALLGIFIAMLVGLAPLLMTTRLRFLPALRQARAGGDTLGGRRARFALIAIEVAGSLALLSGCGLMVRSVVRMLDVELGMDARGLVATNVSLREQTYPDAPSRSALYARLLNATAEVPGFTEVALSNPPPLASYEPQPMRVDDGAETRRATIRSVSANYFASLDIPLSRGRMFTSDDRAGSPEVAIVSESAARQFWPNGDAIGRRVRMMDTQADTLGPAKVVVGVVRDVRQSPTDSVLADLYLPVLQSGSRFAAVIAHGQASSPRLIDDLRRAVATIDPQISVGNLEDLGVMLDRQLARPRFLVLMFALFGGFASLLGVLGLYSVIAYAVQQREHEVAVRIAIGAAPGSIVNLFVREGMVVTVVGLALGIVGAVNIGRLLEGQLFGVRAVDSVALAASTAALIAAALLAVWWPARRAARTDPARALRDEA
jgi:putative ABC transport system permease protein